MCGVSGDNCRWEWILVKMVVGGGKIGWWYRSVYHWWIMLLCLVERHVRVDRVVKIPVVVWLCLRIVML